MKKICFFLMGLMACITFQCCACVALKRMNDRHITRYVNKHLGDVSAAADTYVRWPAIPRNDFP
ncbi:hypothetical protein [Chitinophaga pinensis]|uniref:Uncharacterized protein n=1 Tax=Chitinophaga pinensis TaxID=79329 RepID=A0A5C6LP58_9BACT|nr:hypothetical protein [Chitinophaga pinensis]TWV97950.1 hypothetical protein FEF09_21235 [Chitinophaga pinensis]